MKHFKILFCCIQAACVVAALTTTTVTQAQTSDTQDADADTPPANIPLEAKTLFESGQAAYSEGLFSEAIGYFRESYDLSGDPEVLFHIAECYRELHHTQTAIRRYEAYLAERARSGQSRRSRNKTAAEKHLEELRQLGSETEQRARRAYEEEDYAQALELFREAHQESGDQELLFDIALSIEGLQSRPHARGAYRAYLRALPEGKHAKEAALRLEDVPVLIPARPMVPEALKAWFAPFVVIGAGAAVGAIGGGLMVAGRDQVRDANRRSEAGGEPYPDLQNEADRGKRKWISGEVLIGVGVAAIGGGVAMAVLDRRMRQDRSSASNSQPPALTVGVGPTSITLQGSF